jgi:molybdopterin/thiamine biosynthesis adenylyltransferase/rhodanese-related sulfurtransferase
VSRELPGLTADEERRYGRHLSLAEVGEQGQRKLKAASILLIGAGGLGSPAALYLAAAGVGRLGIVDGDRVELSNLQRQVLYGMADLGRHKAKAAAERLRAMNPEIEVVPLAVRLEAANAEELLAPWDLVLDGSDNAATRYLLNDACVKLGKPDVWGAVLRFEGQLAVFGLPGLACYRCLFPEPPPPGTVPSCAEAGVLGVLPGIVGTLQASAAIDLVLHGAAGSALAGRFLVYDGRSLRFREIRLAADPACPSCADPSRIVLADQPYLCEIPQEEPAMANKEAVPAAIDVATLEAWRQEGRPHLLLDVREQHEWDASRIEGAKLMPLRGLPARLEELDTEAIIVVHCHHGGRSAQAVQYLRSRGFSGATNLAGGIDAWSLQVDPSVPRY